MPTRIFEIRKPSSLYRPLVWDDLPRQVLYPGKGISLDLNRYLTSWFEEVSGVIEVEADSDMLPSGITLSMGELTGSLTAADGTSIFEIVFVATVFGISVESGVLEIVTTLGPLWTDEDSNSLWTDENGVPLWTGATQ